MIEPIVDYHFDECSLDKVIDSSINAYDAKAFNLESSTAKLCKSADFSKSSTKDYIKLNHLILDNIDSFTICVWIKTENKSAGAILSGANENEDDEVVMYFSSSSKFKPYVKGKSTGFKIKEIADNKWHHIAWSREGINNCLYIDGSLQECRKIYKTQGALKIDQNGLLLGQEQDGVGIKFSSSQDFEGLMDELKIFNKELNQTEIASIFNNEKLGKNYDGSERICSSCEDLQSNPITFDAFTHSYSKLLTKIVNEPFSIDINQSTTQNPQDTTIRVELVDSKCKNSLKILSANLALNSSNGYKNTLFNLTYDKAVKAVKIRITNNQTGISNCSSDSFAIRPKAFRLFVDNNTTKISGKNFDVVLEAIDFNDNVAKGYNESFSLLWQKADLNMINLGNLSYMPQKFSDGYAKVSVNYSDCGKIKLIVNDDKEFAGIDANDSSSDIVIKGDEVVVENIIPYSFGVNIWQNRVFQAENNESNYAYLDENNTVLKTNFAIKLKALNFQNRITKNYQSDFNLSFMLTFNDDKFKQTKRYSYNSSFVAGEVTKSISKDFIIDDDRLKNRNIAIEPIKLEPAYFTISDVLINSGDNLNMGEKNITISFDPFYLLFARINPIDSKGFLTTKAKVYFEVYAKEKINVLKELFGDELKESVNDVFWWQNPMHKEFDHFNLFYTIDDKSVSKIYNEQKKSFDEVTFQSNSAKKVKVKINLQNNKKLFFRPYSNNFVTSFYIEFLNTAPAKPQSKLSQKTKTLFRSRIDE